MVCYSTHYVGTFYYKRRVWLNFCLYLSDCDFIFWGFLKVKVEFFTHVYSLQTAMVSTTRLLPVIQKRSEKF